MSQKFSSGFADEFDLLETYENSKFSVRDPKLPLAVFEILDVDIELWSAQVNQNFEGR
jgi:hypothetical protein